MLWTAVQPPRAARSRCATRAPTFPRTRCPQREPRRSCRSASRSSCAPAATSRSWRSAPWCCRRSRPPRLLAAEGISATVVNARFAAPARRARDRRAGALGRPHRHGRGERADGRLRQRGAASASTGTACRPRRMLRIALPETFVTHGKRDELLAAGRPRRRRHRPAHARVGPGPPAPVHMTAAGSRRVGILGHTGRPGVRRAARATARHARAPRLRRCASSARSPPRWASRACRSRALARWCQVLISLGGDGTALAGARALAGPARRAAADQPRRARLPHRRRGRRAGRRVTRGARRHAGRSRARRAGRARWCAAAAASMRRGLRDERRGGQDRGRLRRASTCA